VAYADGVLRDVLPVSIRLWLWRGRVDGSACGTFVTVA
jgi:hypothetical protein